MAKTFNILILCSIASIVQAKPHPTWAGTDLKGEPCSGRWKGYGPLDYTNHEDRKKLPPVEAYHFTQNVEMLIKGQSGPLVNDLDYTLRAVPNHHRALLSTIRYRIQILKKLVTKNLIASPECYLQRAIKFNPKDASLYAIYGYYLGKTGHLKAASKKYEKALEISPDNSKFEYSYSLLLLKLKKYEKAIEYGKKAYSHGNPPEGLKRKLITLGLWK